MTTLAAELEAQIRTGDPMKAEDALERLEEAHYMDGTIDYHQFMTLSRLFQEVTGDHSILNHHS